jgi:hypothetical protein
MAEEGTDCRDPPSDSLLRAETRIRPVWMDFERVLGTSLRDVRKASAAAVAVAWDAEHSENRVLLEVGAFAEGEAGTCRRQPSSVPRAFREVLLP